MVTTICAKPRGENQLIASDKKANEFFDDQSHALVFPRAWGLVKNLS